MNLRPTAATARPGRGDDLADSGTANIGRWRAVEAALAADIESGRLEADWRLPTEPTLMVRFGVGRHTIRRAIAELAARGLVRVEQGRGTFVHRRGPLDYRLSERTRFSENLLDQGREPDGRTIADEEVAAPDQVAAALRLPPGEPVHHLVQQSFADDVPLSYTNAYFPVRRFTDLRRMKRARRSITAIYAAYGVDDYVRLRTLITTRLPSREEASILAQPASLPVVAMTKVDVDMAGVPIGYSESVWAGERVQFSIDNGPQLFGPGGILDRGGRADNGGRS